jgi:hypothetical protein
MPQATEKARNDPIQPAAAKWFAIRTDPIRRSVAIDRSAEVSWSTAHIRFHCFLRFLQAQSGLLPVELDGLNLLGGIIRELLDFFGQAFRASWVYIRDVQMKKDGINLSVQASKATGIRCA